MDCRTKDVDRREIYIVEGDSALGACKQSRDAEFLKRFATLHERMRVNPDEFDYIYYTYGLDWYGNMPLIEPLEYREARAVHDFAIAIDTSESVSGDLVQAFMRKTYNILKQAESFTDRVNIHVIQCDARVQEDTKITSLDELDLYLEDMELKGFGGTDFRLSLIHISRSTPSAWGPATPPAPCASAAHWRMWPPSSAPGMCWCCLLYTSRCV